MEVTPRYGWHHAYDWAPDLDRWRMLVRVVLPKTRHEPCSYDVRVGVSLGQPALMYHVSDGRIGDHRNRKGEGKRKHA